MRARWILGLSFAMVATALPIEPTAAAATITVTTTADEFTDPGPGTGCSLREAVHAANTDAPYGGCPAGVGADTIVLGAAEYVLTLAGAMEDAAATGDLDILEDTTIQGAGAAVTTIDAAGIDRPLDAGGGATDNSVTITIIGVTVTGGQTMGQDAGGIITTVGLLELIDVVVTGNTAPSAGGIHNTGSGSTLTLLRTTVSGNVATSSVAGGIENDMNDTTTITDSAVSGNVAEGSGGGIFTDGILNLTNVTVSGNSTNADGGGIHTTGDSTPSISSSTITGNEADADGDGTGNGGGVAGGDTVTLRNTILAGNTDRTAGAGDSDDCSGNVVSATHSILGHPGGCSYTVGPGDQVGTPASPLDPLLGPLADNGGPTMTHALLPGSPAIDAAGPGAAPTDQRGLPRNPDIGAYELVRCQGVVINRIGSDGDDVLTGTDGADGFLAQGGDDTVNALGGDDGVCLGEGNDRVDAGPGTDVVNGEGGNDIALGGAGKDTASGGPGNDRLSGGGGKDRLKGEAGKDKLRGQGGKDRLRGGPGKDTCNGGPGKDKAVCEKERKV